MSTVGLNKTTLPTTDEINKFFCDMSNRLVTDKFMLETGIASDAMQKAYYAMIKNDQNMLHGMTRLSATRHFLHSMINDFVTELGKRMSIPTKLAFSISDSKLYAWAEIADDDESTENGLFLSEAFVNGKYNTYGVSISTTVVETSDGLSVPEHYYAMPMHTKKKRH